MKINNICCIGAGYVGLVSGVCLAEKGHEVVCVDNDILKVNKINLSISPIYEDGLDELLLKNIGITASITSMPKYITTAGLLWLLRGRMRKQFLITRWLLNSSLTTPKHIATLGLLCLERGWLKKPLLITKKQ